MGELSPILGPTFRDDYSSNNGVESLLGGKPITLPVLLSYNDVGLPAEALIDTSVNRYLFVNLRIAKELVARGAAY